MTSFEWAEMAKYGVAAGVVLLLIARLLMRGS